MNPLAILAFLTGPIGRWVSIGLIGLAIFFAGELRGRRIANANCEAKAQEAIRAATQQDAKARTEVQKQSDTTIEELREQKEKADARVAQLQLQLSALPLDAPCLYGADGKPAASRVRNKSSPAPRASNPRASGPASVPAASPGTAGPRGK